MGEKTTAEKRALARERSKSWREANRERYNAYARQYQAKRYEAKGKSVGEEHHRWKGDDIAYTTAHDRVRRARGRPCDHLCADGCGKEAAEWSYNGGCPRELSTISLDGRNGAGREVAYSPDVEMYSARCRGCHVKYDKSRS